MYITYEEYTPLYGEIGPQRFHMLCCDACRIMDNHTTGIDNVRKLKSFFPTNEDDAMAVKFCAAKLINFLNQIMEAEISASMSRGFEETAQGVRGRVITSVTAGNESISYSAGSTAAATAAEAAARDKNMRNELVADIVHEGLAGINDANGVSLLYMARYPVC